VNTPLSNSDRTGSSRGIQSKPTIARW
jgi:hypothetical protein